MVAVPSLAAGEALISDWTEAFWVVAEDFTITPSRDYAPAYGRDSIALRTSDSSGSVSRTRPRPSVRSRSRRPVAPVRRPGI
ncbi:hypothetical protein GCM10009743_22870 [Kribbella swartbergensis]